MLSATIRCRTLSEGSVDRGHTPCDDNTRVISRYNTVLGHRETTIIPSPRRNCRGHMNVRTPQVEVCCR